MQVSVILPYDEASKYYERWAHEEKNIDFKNDKFSANRCTLSFAAEEICLHLERAGIEVRVTDEKLLELTGGIVQGMSGSPIIQNEKLIGAVTHVLVNEPEKGYGIFIESMLNSEN